jgi:serine/threonine protein kinase
MLESSEIKRSNRLHFETKGTEIYFSLPPLLLAYKFVRKYRVNKWYEHVPLEVLLMTRLLNCDKVVQIVNAFETRSEWCIMMERLYNSQDLFELIEKKDGLEEDLAKHFTKQIMEAILTCYENCVCHRDIKEENVLVNLDTMDIMLIDFGAGEFCCDGNRTFTDFYGTYMPPEYKYFGSYDDESMSVWCLGIMVYQMITNLNLYDYLYEEPFIEYPCEMSSSCRNFIEKCLRSQPQRRPKLLDLFAHPWMKEEHGI